MIKINQTVAAFLLSMMFVSCGHTDKAEKKEAPDALEKVETFQLEKQTITTEISLPAELSGFRQVDLFAKVSSYVKTMSVDIGSDIKAGQLLVELEAPEMTSQLTAAQSRVHAAEATYAASNGTYQRVLETSKTEGTISKNDLDLAKSKKDIDFAQLAAARASIKEIGSMQNYLQIRAPFNGKVTARNVNTGAFVGQGSQIPLLTVQDQQKLRLAISIPEAYTGYLKLGNELTFTVVAMPGETFKAKISRMAGALDLRLRAERIELDVINKENKLLPGMVASAKLPLKSRIASFVVPKTAVMTTSEGVFVVKSNKGLAKRIKIVTGMQTGDQIEIFGDELQEKDKLLSIANEELKEGDRI